MDTCQIRHPFKNICKDHCWEEILKKLAIILVFGDRVFTAVAIPAMSPPPPTGTTIASASTHCSTISRPIVPVNYWSLRKRTKIAPKIH